MDKPPFLVSTRFLTAEQILLGYDRVASLYPYVPPLSMWRAWECAAYNDYHIDGKVLDVGCGDGGYFRLIWPSVTTVTGVDMDSNVVELGRRSGVYDEVYLASAHEIPVQDSSFDHAFANCSLEHMDNLTEVLGEIFRCLKVGGSLLCSVVTDRFAQWPPLPRLLALAGQDSAAELLSRDFLDYHHLINPLTVKGWIEKFSAAGFQAEEHVPILPKINSEVFLLLDSLWHVKTKLGDEMGSIFHSSLVANVNFPRAFRTILSALLSMETNWKDCSGAVFLVRKPT